MFYRMLGEHEPLRQALENAHPAEGEDCQALVDIAYHQGVHPKKKTTAVRAWIKSG